jgi:hypothetical protein
MHKVHFSATFFSVLNLITAKGHADIQTLHPLHRLASIATIPSSRLLMAFVGQASAQGGLAQ